MTNRVDADSSATSYDLPLGRELYSRYAIRPGVIALDGIFRVAARAEAFGRSRLAASVMKYRAAGERSLYTARAPGMLHSSGPSGGYLRGKVVMSPIAQGTASRHAIATTAVTASPVGQPASPSASILESVVRPGTMEPVGVTGSRELVADFAGEASGPPSVSAEFLSRSADHDGPSGVELSSGMSEQPKGQSTPVPAEPLPTRRSMTMNGADATGNAAPITYSVALPSSNVGLPVGGSSNPVQHVNMNAASPVHRVSRSASPVAGVPSANLDLNVAAPLKPLQQVDMNVASSAHSASRTASATGAHAGPEAVRLSAPHPTQIGDQLSRSTEMTFDENHGRSDTHSVESLHAQDMTSRARPELLSTGMQTGASDLGSSLPAIHIGTGARPHADAARAKVQGSDPLFASVSPMSGSASLVEHASTHAPSSPSSSAISGLFSSNGGGAAQSGNIHRQGHPDSLNHAVNPVGRLREKTNDEHSPIVPIHAPAEMVAEGFFSRPGNSLQQGASGGVAAQTVSPSMAGAYPASPLSMPQRSTPLVRAAGVEGIPEIIHSQPLAESMGALHSSSEQALSGSPGEASAAPLSGQQSLPVAMFSTNLPGSVYSMAASPPANGHHTLARTRDTRMSAADAGLSALMERPIFSQARNRHGLPMPGASAIALAHEQSSTAHVPGAFQSDRHPNSETRTASRSKVVEAHALPIATHLDTRSNVVARRDAKQSAAEPAYLAMAGLTERFVQPGSAPMTQRVQRSSTSNSSGDSASTGAVAVRLHGAATPHLRQISGSGQPFQDASYGILARTESDAMPEQILASREICLGAFRTGAIEPVMHTVALTRQMRGDADTSPLSSTREVSLTHLAPQRAAYAGRDHAARAQRSMNIERASTPGMSSTTSQPSADLAKMMQLPSVSASRAGVSHGAEINQLANRVYEILVKRLTSERRRREA